MINPHKCSECVFYDFVGGGLTLADCRKYAPVVDGYSRFPKVDENAWCGDWQSRPKVEDD